MASYISSELESSTSYPLHLDVRISRVDNSANATALTRGLASGFIFVEFEGQIIFLDRGLGQSTQILHINYCNLPINAVPPPPSPDIF